MVKADVLVAGGGPAGVLSALTAAKLSDQKLKVILVDAKPYSEIGNKVCGDAINMAPVTFLEEKLGIEKPHGDEIADLIEHLIFKTEKASFPIQGDGFVLNRHPYGQRLLTTAEKYGVEVRSDTRVVKALITDGVVTGAVVKNKKINETYEIRARITIDCTGRNFQIRKSFPKELFPNLEKHMEKRDVAASYREIIRLKGEDHPYRKEIYLLYHDEIPEPGYFWIFTKGEKRLNVGIGWFLDTKVDKGMKECYREVLHKYYPEGSYIVEHHGGGQVPTRYPMTNAVAPGFMTVGDAAFHVNPLSAEGHGPALTAGYYAGKAAVAAITANDVTETQLWQYNIDVMNHFGLSHTKIQLFTAALRTVKVKGLEFLLKRKILTKQQFIDLHAGKKLTALEILKISIRAFPRYGILWNIYKIAKGARIFEELFTGYPQSPEGYPAWQSRFETTMNQIRAI
ncbi:MAG: NAD(P)/FAD-dependent oxidoreductase [Candidatus Heimdallarchaeota archaeon]|nr:MAG: NAD(P)/FAD-dependent oxidoreductase [Candidatus Heimdallarchaeota archaeon]